MESFLASLGYAVDSERGLLPFILLTLLIGGGAAWRTGQAVAQGWGAMWPVAAYTALLAAGIRFLHFALFGGPLLSLPSYLIDFAILAVIALVGHRARRARHMTEQYGWMFERSGPLTWRDRS
ncbi:DUF6867 family protein [uncultured Hyphomicrobium sp.]|uniref:DUF6867 family protein n=1 Tax=uncultured Hyphomicrobium sp. TaxID=194373 RepID=UPI0025E83E2C|nr:hypothetical protein [uncultured Hyphomicrobium sp.]